MTKFADYVRHGWQLCPIREGEKRPRGDGWNKRENAITDPARAEHLVNAGLLHGFSGTCAIDIDNYDVARAWFKQHDIDLDALFAAPDAVQIVSGDSSRGKLIYALDTPLPTKQIHNPDDKSQMILELRCHARTGNSAQDVLPPSTNPRTGKQYAWKYNDELQEWRSLPTLPPALRSLWDSMLAPKVERTAEELVPTAETDELLKLIAGKDPDSSYEEWIKIGMMLNHETGGSDVGLSIWDAFSARGAKYKGTEDLATHYASFGNSSTPVTAGAFRREQVATDDDFGPPVDQDLLAAVERQAHEQRLAQFKWRRPSEIVTEPPLAWLIRDILPQEGINALYGPSGSGKSFEALDMGLAISRGIDWREYKTMQGAVGWIAAEAYGSMRNRLLAYCKTHGIAPDQLVDFYVLGTSVRMQDAEQMAALTESARPMNLRLLIVDTLAAATPGTDENSGEDMSPVMENVARIYDQLGCTILLIHHTGKDETKGMRGHSSIKARVEAELLVKKRDGSPLRDMIPTKLRNSNKEGVLHPFKLAEVPVDMDDVGVITSASVEHIKAEDAVPAQKITTDTKRGNKALAFDTLESLWPIDGEPVISIDAFIARYIEGLVRPEGEDTRVTKAMRKLDSLAEQGHVVVDNIHKTVTLLKSNAKLAPLTDEGDPDADLI